MPVTQRTAAEGRLALGWHACSTLDSQQLNVPIGRHIQSNNIIIPQQPSHEDCVGANPGASTAPVQDIDGDGLLGDDLGDDANELAGAQILTHAPVPAEPLYPAREMLCIPLRGGVERGGAQAGGKEQALPLLFLPRETSRASRSAGAAASPSQTRPKADGRPTEDGKENWML
ncbi:hypothetical protein AURDEDRAFT_171763 [Auricularia subglabra TFB-10046 SS5]|nr:hypothetical protein AURDEDRAFT_171763 [Auricularia subglabra TFB-10046 SS5]